MSRLGPTTFVTCLALSSAFACGDDVVTDTANPETGDATTGADTTGATDTTGDGDGGDGDGTGGPVCGDMVVDPGEQCDDGNDVDDDACSNDCQARCGMEWDTKVDAPTMDADPAIITGVSVGTGDAIFAVGTVADGTDKIWLGGFDASGAATWSTTVDTGAMNADGNAIAADGSVAYVTGSVDSADGSDIWIAKIDDTGAILWERTVDGAFDGEDWGGGVTVGADGNPIFAGTIFNADMDSDVWVSRVDAATGAELWASTHSGVPVSGFSLDRGGPVAVDSTGNVYVQTQIYFAFNRTESGVAKIPAGGGPAMWEVFPRDDGTNHTHWPQGIAVTSDDEVVFTLDSYEVAVRYYEGWTYRYDAMGNEVWGVTTFDMGLDVAGEDIMDEGYITDGLALDASDNVVVGGNWFWDDPFQPNRVIQPWSARYSPTGELMCAWAGETDNGAGVSTQSVAVQSTGTAIIGGGMESPSRMWVGGFRG